MTHIRYAISDKTAEPDDSTIPDSKELPEGEEGEIWKTYVDEATKKDKENITNWNQSIDVLLVFVRLFPPPLVIYCLANHCNPLDGFIFGYPNRIHHRVL